LNYRLEKLRKTLTEKGHDNLVISYLPNIFYITGFSGSSGLAFCSDDYSFLITDGRYTIQAKEEVKDFDVVLQTQGASLYKTLFNELKKKGINKIWIESPRISYETYQALVEKFEFQVVPTKNIVEELRYCKSEEEIVKIQRAVDIAIESFLEVLPLVKPGIRETDLASELYYRFMKRGAKSFGFPLIVASGHRSALPHGSASDKIIEDGDIITFDFGAEIDGYCSDLTRTYMVGKSNPKAKKFYDIVYEAQERALEGMKTGMKGKEIDALARGYIEKQGYGPLFDHGLGHSIGIEVHEAPSLSSLSETVTQEGMLFTVEPGIYEKGFGGVRIEDDVLITSNGVRILSEKLPKKFQILS
jgi:Xaa-Pro aminopeptidase